MKVATARALGKLNADPHAREILRGSAIGLAVKVLAAGSMFLMNVVVARKLGIDEAGLFFLGFTLVTVLATIGRLGLDNSLIRFIASAAAAGDNGALHGVYRKALLWAAVASVALMLAVLASLGLLTQVFDQSGFVPVVGVMALAIPLVAVYNLYAQALKGLKMVAQSMATLNVVMPLALLAGLFLPLTTALDVAWVYLAACGVALAAGYWWWRGAAPRGIEAQPFATKMLRASCLPLWGVAFLEQCVQWSSQLLLGVWGSGEQVALFAAAQRTAMLTSFVLVAVNAIAAPKFAAMHSQNDLEGLRRMALVTVRLMLLAALPILVLILLFPGWLMGLFGEDFRAAAPALVVLAIGQFVNIASGSVGFLLSMTGHEKVLRANIAVSAAVGLYLGAWLIPALGINGAAIATAMAVASQNLLGVYQVNRLLGFNNLAVWRKL